MDRATNSHEEHPCHCDDTHITTRALRFELRERLLSIGDDYWIENGQGQRSYKVDGKALRFRDTDESTRLTSPRSDGRIRVG